MRCGLIGPAWTTADDGCRKALLLVVIVELAVLTAFCIWKSAAVSSSMDQSITSEEICFHGMCSLRSTRILPVRTARDSFSRENGAQQEFHGLLFILFL